MAEDKSTYAASLSIDYPDRDLDRLSTFFRIFFIIPINIIVALLANQSSGIVFLPLILMILFRKKYPIWWFDWNLAMTRFLTRVNVYSSLLTDVYPSTDEEQSVHIDIRYPDTEKELNRWLPLVKWILVIPHLIVLYCLWIAVVVVCIIAWFAILFTKRYPRALFDFVVAVYRWGLRVFVYAYLLTTDRYPPFSLE